MKKSELRLVDYLEHIRVAIEKISDYTKNMTEDGFHRSDVVQDAVIRNMEIIGEASNNIQKDHEDFALNHPEIPLKIAYSMRNALSHGYFSVDIGMVWDTVANDLPGLLQRVQHALEELLRSDHVRYAGKEASVTDKARDINTHADDAGPK